LYSSIKSTADDKGIDCKELVLYMVTEILEYVKEDNGIIKLPVQDTIENQLADLGTSLENMGSLEEEEQK